VLIVLPVAPVCRVVELTLPRTTLQPTDRERLRVKAHGVDLDVDKCVGPLLGTEVLQVRLPQAPLGVGHIDVELGGTRPGRPTAQFSGRYEGAWPTVPFALRFKQVTFTWRRPQCIYPKDRCPEATLENGTVCAGTPSMMGCEYRCPGEIDDAAGDIVLPLEVTFEKQSPAQRWTDKLARSGQTLTSYVDSDEIYLNANVNHWITDVPDNTITGVEIYGEDGEARRYGVTPLPPAETPESTGAPDQDVVEGERPARPRAFQLKIPGASCEPIRYKPLGDRQYNETEAAVRDGNVEFRKPWKQARAVGFNVTLAVGGGPAVSTYREPDSSAPVYFSGLGMFAVELRPRKPKFARLAFELRFGGMLGRYAVTEELSDETAAEETDERFDGAHKTLPEGTDSEESADSQTRAGGWARILGEPGLVISAHQRVAVGMGFGLGMALPFRGNEDIVSERLRFIYSPNVDVRFRVRKFLKLILQFRGVLNEQPFRQGDPERTRVKKEDWAGSFITLFGVQAAF